MRNYFKLLRVSHWVKNGFLLAPLFFSGLGFSTNHIEALILGFLSFSLMASAVYVLNDLKDLESDKIHPEKCKRPIASGSISKNVAVGLFLICFVASVLLSCVLPSKFIYIVIFYFVMNLAYTLKLKEIAIVDVFIIAFGFVLRVLAGGVLVHVEVSQWLFILTFLLALFLGFAKRRDDLILKKNQYLSVRKASEGYNLAFIDATITILLGLINVTYLFYCIDDQTKIHYNNAPLFISGIFILCGTLRYFQLTIVYEKSGSPTKILLKDTFLQLVITAWVLLLSYFLYFYGK